MNEVIGVYPDGYKWPENPDNLIIHEAFELLTGAVAAINGRVDEKLLGENMDEVFASAKFAINSPIVMSQILIQNLGEDNFMQNEKLYWLQVAMEMGPDWITKLRKVVAFMDKVEGF